MIVHPRLFWCFFISMFLPTAISISLGPLRLSLYRITLIIFFIMSAQWIASACKPKLGNPNFFVVCYAVWALLSLLVNHGFGDAIVSGTIETGGIYLLETVGPYLIVIAFCNSVRRLQQVIRLYLLIISLSLLVTIPESLTDINWFKSLLHPIFPSPPTDQGQRLGLYRAAGSFDHPILQGVIAATAVGLAWYCGGMKRVPFVIVAAITSVSSGAIVAILIQFMLIGWDRITNGVQNRWWMLFGGFLAFYLAIDLLSSKSALRTLLSNFTMSPQTAYYRLLIWEHGLENAYNNPYFGLGQHDWVRPAWMHSGSMDAFWLVSIVKYGFVGFFFSATAIILVIYKLMSFQVSDKALLRIRRGWLVGMAGIILSSTTVHLWNNAYVFFNFYLGLGTAAFLVMRRAKRQANADRQRRLLAQSQEQKPELSEIAPEMAQQKIGICSTTSATTTISGNTTDSGTLGDGLAAPTLAGRLNVRV